MFTPKDKLSSRWTCKLDFGFAVTLFGYQIGFSFDLIEWHLVFDHYKGIGYLIYFGPIAFDILDSTKLTPIVDPAIAPLKYEIFEQEKLAAKYYVELEQTKKALEQETVRLAGCGVAAIGAGTPPDPANYGYSAAYEAIYILYKKYKQALTTLDQLQVRLEAHRNKEKKEKKTGDKNVKSKSLPTRKSSRKN
jgi:hypothetical protein